MKKKSSKNQKTTYPRPQLVLSECLTGANVRFNAEPLTFDWLKIFAKHVDIISVCPEMEIGLGVPRPPIWSISSPSGPRLIQPFTGKDITAKMGSFSKKFLSKHGNADGFLLKSRSPSCGLDRVKLYAGADRAPVIGYTIGQFTRKVHETYPELVVSDERLMAKRNHREEFLTMLFVTAAFREMTGDLKSQSLGLFHLRYSLLLDSLNVNRAKKMAKLLESCTQKNVTKDTYTEYRSHLSHLLERKHRVPAHKLVLNRMIKNHVKGLSTEEKRRLNSSLKRYENKTILFTDLAAIITDILKPHGLLTKAISTFLSPFPAELLTN